MSDWMLWGRFGGSVQLGSAPPPRLYLIPVSSSIDHEGPLAFQLGHRNRSDRTLEDFTRALDRAVSAEADGVVFPSSFLTLPFRDDVLTRCRNRKLRVVHQVTCEALMATDGTAAQASARLDELMRRLDAGDALNLVFGADNLPKDTLLARLTRWPDLVYFTYSVRAKDPVLEILHLLQPYVRERLFFHFPFHLEFGDGHLNCRQVYELTEKIRSRVPGVRVRPMLGLEMFDPRVDPDLELEPVYKPKWDLRSNAGADHLNRVPIEVSVIIPSYDNRDYVVNTVRHLARQDFPKSQFEIIVVDDGSSDGTEEALRIATTEFLDQLNFKYIHSPRLRPRKMGDANYRAGISRNLGVKNSVGRILCFLDSDILTPPGFLTDLVKKHQMYDVIQCKRLNLKLEKSDDVIRYDEVNPVRDTFTTEDGYWEKFYSLRDWSKAPFFWKYTCTYGLSISARLFKRVGWIRRGFVFYGFEDVELGYRLARVGARFHLNDVVTYHLFHRNERSEFHNSDYLRQSLLAKTAQIFFLGLLEPDIYMHFRGLMKEQIPFSGVLSAWRIQIPFLALWNWRWFLWRQWQRIKNVTYRTLKSAGWPVDAWIQKIDVVKERWSDVSRRLQLWRLTAAVRFIWAQRWRVFVAWTRLMSQRWRLKVAALRLYGLTSNLLRKGSYPIRKVYYIGSYQWRKRVRGRDARAAEESS